MTRIDSPVTATTTAPGASTNGSGSARSTRSAWRSVWHRMTMRIGTGFDVHALVAGRPLVLGGVTIPHPRGLAGHSDADVLLHAIADALLGALALGDLGAHFPDSDAALARTPTAACCCVTSSRWSPRAAMASATSTPRSSRRRRSSRRSSRRCARTSPPTSTATSTRVSIKATTTERLGFTGRGEGIAAEAVVLVAPREVNAAAVGSQRTAARAPRCRRPRAAGDRTSAVQARDAVDDRKPESRAGRAVGARRGFGRARERLLQALDLVRRDAGTAIGDVDARHAARAPRSRPRPAARRRRARCRRDWRRAARWRSA